MIAGMTPVLVPGRFVFASVPDTALLSDAVAMMREAEGVSLILPVDVARREGLAVAPVMVCITLNVYSSLEGVGLTAAVAGVLADLGIACNMVAGCHHDHAFVPADRADEAMAALLALQKAGSRA